MSRRQRRQHAKRKRTDTRRVTGPVAAAAAAASAAVLGGTPAAIASSTVSFSGGVLTVTDDVGDDSPITIRRNADGTIDVLDEGLLYSGATNKVSVTTVD